ncbi:MAG: hypothetical protein RLZZ86_327 [Cyanobacteriota bacterium]|jgi:hypothetical protein
MDTLFNLADYETSQIITDPYWDKLNKKDDLIVLDANGVVEANGQTSLFYDDADEPPDPDDYQNLDDYHHAWDIWRKNHPNDSVTAMTYDDGDFLDDSVTDDFLDDSVTTFEVGGIYWHKQKKLQFKITKLFKTVPKAQGYFAGDPFLVKILIDELVTESPVTESPVTELPVTELEDIELDEIENSVTGLSTYKPKGKARGSYFYYRYSYRDGQRIKHIHIPGGNTNSEVVQERVKKLREEIARGMNPLEIKSLIASFKLAN